MVRYYKEGSDMEMLDCSGLNCPEPVLRTKAHLEKNLNEAFGVLVDNEASRENVLRFSKSRGCEARVTDSADKKFLIHVIPGEEVIDENFEKGEYVCELVSEVNFVYVIASDSMGRGSDELGWALLQTYVTTIAEISPLPSHILLYNGGVKLACTPGKALESLQLLEKKAS